MSPHEGLPIGKLPGISNDLVVKLKASWITTVEQFVAATAATGGSEAMAKNLGVAHEEVQRALAAAEAAIPADDLNQYKSPADTRDYGLGARPQEED